MGANTAVFSLINGLLLRPLPVPHGDQLVVMRMEEGGPQPEYDFCTPFFRSLEARQEVFSDVFAYNPDILQVQGRSGNENIHGMLVSGQFFPALQTPPLLGRCLTPEDDRRNPQSGGPRRRHYRNLLEDVVGDTKYRDMRTPAPPIGYVPIMQDEQAKPSLHAVVRMDGPLAALASAARSLAARLAPAIPAPTVSTMDEVLNDSITSERMMALLAMFFAGCALFVTAMGLYGTLAYATARRTSEIGIRMALGAQRTSVLVMVFQENALIAVFGAGTGLGAALLASRTLANFLYETSPRDPWMLVGSVATLIVIAGAASLWPALRAARIEQMAAIRCE